MRVRVDMVRGRDAPRVVEVEAQNVDAARRALSVQGWTVLAARSVGPWWRWPVPRAASTEAARLDVVVLVEQLRDLLGAGLSVIEALHTLQRGASAAGKPLLDALIRRLHAGERLSDALAAEPGFSALLVALVRASELTSNLPQALARFLEHEQRVRELRHRISSVAIYPVLLTGVGLAVLLFLLLYVMPRFARVFEGMTGPLPWSARAMVWWAQWLQAHGPWILGAAVALGLAAASAAMSRAARVALQRRLFAWGPLRARLRTYFLARWYRATGMLVEGGIPLPEALALSNGLLPHGLREGGAATERALRDGHAPADAHACAGMATPVAEQLMRAGERTGDLGGVLGRIARFHDAEVARALERGMRALEPVVMVLIGVGVGAVVVLMYLPIFELAAAIQ